MRLKTCCICGNKHQNSLSKTCSLGCARKHTSNLKKLKEEKIKIKKEKVKVKKQNSISYLDKKANKLWGEAVKLNYGYRCAKCNKGPEEVQLHPHHLFTRSRKATKWDIDNGICLCASHHTLSSEFSAHKCPLEFYEWLVGIKGQNFVDIMSNKSREICKVTPEYIQENIKILQQFIEKNS